jgi:molybdenum cofactor synthesis domain-containing protein
VTRRAVVIVSSTRAANGTYEDRTGPIIVDWMVDHGFETATPIVVADGPDVEKALREAIADEIDLIVTTGGTGIGPGDATADATAALLDTPMPGVAEELRRRGAETTPRAILSRGVAGIANKSFIVNFPGSTGGVRDGLQLLGELIDHVLDQLAGGSHD